MRNLLITTREVIGYSEGEEFQRGLSGIATDLLRFGEIDITKSIKRAFTFYDDGEERRTYLTDPFNATAIDESWGSRELFRQLCAAIDAAPAGKKDVMLFVHGYAGHLSRVMDIVRALNEEYIEDPSCSAGTLITFFWPSQDIPGANYDAQAADARTSGRALAKFYSRLQHYITHSQKDIKVHLLCQSMGNQVLQAMAGALEERFPGGQDLKPLFHEIILTGADVDEDAFENSSFKSLPLLGKRINVYYGNDDVVLKSSEGIHGKSRLGQRGPSGNFPQGVYFANTTLINDTIKTMLGQEHMHFMYNQKVISDISGVLKGITLAEVKREIA